MAKTYRAIRDSFGFRGAVWARGDIATDVLDDENINEHFEVVPKGEKAEALKDPSFEPREPETLSGIQNAPPKTESVLSKKATRK